MHNDTLNHKSSIIHYSRKKDGQVHNQGNLVTILVNLNFGNESHWILLIMDTNGGKIHDQGDTVKKEYY